MINTQKKNRCRANGTDSKKTTYTGIITQVCEAVKPVQNESHIGDYISQDIPGCLKPLILRNYYSYNFAGYKTETLRDKVKQYTDRLAIAVRYGHQTIDIIVIREAMHAELRRRYRMEIDAI